MKRAGGRFLEPEAQVEGVRFVVRGVDRQSSHPRLLGNGRVAEHGVLKQRAPDPSILVGTSNRKAGKNDNRNGTFRRLPPKHPGRRVGCLDLADRQGVVADYFRAAARRDEGSCRAGSLGMARVLHQPRIQRLLPAVETL